MKDLKAKVVGTKTFSGPIDITDPGYDKCCGRQINKIIIEPGEYTFVVWKDENKRNEILGIYLNMDVPDENAMLKIGVISVDAGMAGFFENKPDYSFDEWDKFCAAIYKSGSTKTAWIIDCGCFANSGYGDGLYEVFVRANAKGIVNAIEIRC